MTVPVNTDASGDTVYLDGNLSALGLGQPDWAAAGIPMTRVSATQWTATIDAAADAHPVLQVRPGRQLEQRGEGRRSARTSATGA